MAFLSLWIQLASFFFLLSGLVGDLLAIRFFLVLAYSFLVLNALLGSPLWPHLVGDAAISTQLGWDSFFWATVALYVQGCSLVNLTLDERAVHLPTPYHEALWRMFYRTGGLSIKLFDEIVASHVKVIHLDPGKVIDTDDYFYIVYQGKIKLFVMESDRNHGKQSSPTNTSNAELEDQSQWIPKTTRLLRSGEMFDITYLDLFSEDSSRFWQTSHIKCTTLTQAILFQIKKTSMQEMAHHRLAKSVWQGLLINNLSYVVEGYATEKATVKHDKNTNRSKEQQDAIRNRLNQPNYHDKIFGPLDDWEQPKAVLPGSGSALKRPLRHLFASMHKSLSLPWPFGGHPTGIRQTQLPPPPASPQLRDPSHHRRFHTQLSRLGAFLRSSSSLTAHPEQRTERVPPDEPEVEVAI